ncbi:unnamed protein product [marine sediment metagenome]|uniref:Uncharacterized protein n=1 Tax=marine sediment metagenome TaxID=412755 RepID=X1CJ60_9ZZZZ
MGLDCTGTKKELLSNILVAYAFSGQLQYLYLALTERFNRLGLSRTMGHQTVYNPAGDYRMKH